MQYQAYHLYQHGKTSREIYSNKVRICVYRDLYVEVSTSLSRLKFIQRSACF